MPNTEWHYSTGDEHQHGRVTANELNRLAESGELRADDLVWKEGMDEWVPASRIKGLEFSAASQEPTASPPPTRFDAETLQSAFKNALRHVDKVAAFSFLDLTLSRSVTPALARVVWFLALGLFVAMLILSPIAWLFDGDEYSLRMLIISLLVYFFMLVMLRIALETFVVIFRIAEYLRQMNEKLASK